MTLKSSVHAHNVFITIEIERSATHTHTYSQVPGQSIMNLKSSSVRASHSSSSILRQRSHFALARSRGDADVVRKIGFGGFFLFGMNFGGGIDVYVEVAAGAGELAAEAAEVTTPAVGSSNLVVAPPSRLLKVIDEPRPIVVLVVRQPRGGGDCDLLRLESDIAASKGVHQKRAGRLGVPLGPKMASNAVPD